MQNKRIGIFLTVFFLIVILHFVIYVFTALNAIGDEALSSSTLNTNWFLNYLVGFPISIFKKGFPLFLPGNESWKVPNILLQLFNILVQSVLILALYNCFMARKRR